MTEKRSYALSMLGMVEREARVIKSICAISGSRAHSYRVTELEAAEILVVDGDNAEALIELKRTDPDRKVPTVYLTADGRALGQFSLRRPVLPAALLKMLDQIRQTTHLQPPRPVVVTELVRFVALVVDDSPTVCHQMRIALTDMGGRVEIAETGEQALGLLERGGIDMVFLDVVLPGADGYQICKTIKRNRQHKDLPVIMLTSKSSPFDKVRGSLAGCNTYLTKPAELETLRAVVAKYEAANRR